MIKLTLAALATFALVLAPLAFSQSYSITDLGTLPGGTYSTGLAVNDHGTVAGYSSLSNGVEHAVIWAGGRIHDIETLGDSASNSEARGINNSGQVVGDSFLSDHVTLHAFSWTKTAGMEDLGTLGGTISSARGINNVGQIVGLSSLSGDLSTHAFLWTATNGMQDMGTLGGTVSYALGINDAGAVVGYSYLSGDVIYHAFVWTMAGGMQDLGAFDGADSDALAINSFGQIAGVGYQTVSHTRSARWSASNMIQDLGAGLSSEAFAINDSGQIVGEYVSGGFLWTPTAHTQNLNDLIPPNSGFTVGAAVGINRSGQIAVAATVPNGNAHAALLTPVN